MDYDKEFSHTIIHKYNVFSANPIENYKKPDNHSNKNSNNNVNGNNNNVPFSNRGGNNNHINKDEGNQARRNNEAKEEHKQKVHHHSIRDNKLNPNFKKVNENMGKETHENQFKIEIYEPKKKVQKSVDKMLIQNNNNEMKKPSIVLVQQDKKEIMNKEKKETDQKVKRVARSIEKNDHEKEKASVPKDNNNLKKLIQEMREKKKKEKINDDNLVQWVGMVKHQQNNEEVKNQGEEEKIKDYLNTHKMLIEMDKIDKEEKMKSDCEEVIEDAQKLKAEFINLKIEDVVRNENYIEENFSIKKIDGEEEEANFDYSALECIKINMEKELGDVLFANLYQIIDNSIEYDASTYDESLIKKVKDEMFLIQDAEAINLAVSRVQDVFDLVIKERRASVIANKNK